MSESKQWAPSRWTFIRVIRCLRNAKRAAIGCGEKCDPESPDFIGAAVAGTDIDYAVSLATAEAQGLQGYFPKRG